MSKEDKAPKVDIKQAVETMPQTGCVVCGSYAGEFTGVAGHARWHSACEGARPDVIAKVRARA